VLYIEVTHFEKQKNSTLSCELRMRLSIKCISFVWITLFVSSVLIYVQKNTFLILCSKPYSTLPLVHTIDTELSSNTIKIALFLGVLPCSLVDRYQCSGGKCCLLHQGRRVSHFLLRRWGQQVPPKHWYPSTKLCSVTYLHSCSHKNLTE
jgi:hypothetical protein